MSELLVAIEGLDGAGKTTQVSMLADALSADRKVEVVSFPRYDTFFGREVRRLLDGDGDGGSSAQTVEPRSMALWYALDRISWARERFGSTKPTAELAAGPATDRDTVVLLNRYSLSNAVYQSARPGASPDLFDWVLRMEHDELGLPRPDVTLLLDVSPTVSRRRVADRGDRDGDVYERSQSLLERVRDGYHAAAELLPIEVVQCLDESGDQRQPADIHSELVAVLDKYL